MASDMFLDLGSTIKGESKDAAYEGKIDILGWDWGMSQTGSSHTGGGAGTGKVSIQDITISKYVDSSSANFMLYCAAGKHFEEGKIVCRKAGDDPLEYLVINMKKIMVTSVSTGGSPGEERLTETVNLSFAEVEVEYTAQEDQGAGEAGIVFGWNIEQNIKL
ncbi:MAG: type VI secretion system tube protein Hcp [Gammaproteobacteria bacterium]|nr:type VI secretion system tube protein Hcp [Gammaproteobacteria bacterium]